MSHKSWINRFFLSNYWLFQYFIRFYHVKILNAIVIDKIAKFELAALCKTPRTEFHILRVWIIVLYLLSIILIEILFASIEALSVDWNVYLRNHLPHRTYIECLSGIVLIKLAWIEDFLLRDRRRDVCEVYLLVLMQINEDVDLVKSEATAVVCDFQIEVITQQIINLRRLYLVFELGALLCYNEDSSEEQN